MEESDTPKGFLTGLNIIDLADEKASFCTKLMADFGARVIKIEKPGGDPSRKAGPFLNNDIHPEKSLSFFYNNTGKYGITLDIENNDGKSIFLKLIKKNDIVVETFQPGFLEENGMGFEDLKKANPRLILVSVTGFGQNGPKKDHQSCDMVASAAGGQMYISGSPSTPPLKPFGEQAYFTASLFATVGIFLAVRKRRQTGEGTHIDISLQEAVTSTLEHVMVRFFYENIVSTRQGTHNTYNNFCIMPCKDGFIQMELFQQWETLVEWMDGKGMAQDLMDEKFRDEACRNENRDYIIGVIQQWTKTYTINELHEMGQLMRFPWAPVCSPKVVSKSPHLKAREFFKDIIHENLDTTLKYPGVPYKFSELTPGPKKRAPMMGEDNLDIYQEELGLTKKQLKTLASRKVI